MKKAFTLAEVMIVLTVIGILAGILIPVANNSRPDENVMKFKKAHATLSNVIHELVTSDKYYANGDLSKKANGNRIYGGFSLSGCGQMGSENDIKYFCETFADIISTKSVNCSTAKTAGDDYTITFVEIPTHEKTKAWHSTLEEGKNKFDVACSTVAQTVGAEIVSNDDIIYYQTNPQATFGIAWDSDNCQNIDNKLFSSVDNNNLIRIYKVMCIDIDGINKGEDPFGYGIRIDGQILTGKRADEWLEKGFQKGKNDN